MDPSSSSNGRQKRVLPSRTRRGGPVVGTCDTDIMILEHHKRRFETESIIPADTPFLLTTNPEVFIGASSSSAKPSITTVTSERYFDRPEVLKAYREQLIIETPSFSYVADIPSVGGRFRPRGPEDSQIDTSDAAYERRHRKYETFEKRQRLREKEKLKHEQYKLKERIEQLRVMDPSAFLALPVSHFSSAPGPVEESTQGNSTHVDGAVHNPNIQEGERRRKEMLEVALTLEERYRLLLPSERLRKLQSHPTPAATPAPSSVSGTRDTLTPVALPPSRRTVFETVESEYEEDWTEEQKQDQRLRIKLKFGQKDKGKAVAPVSSESHSPAPTSASRTSRKSGRMSLPPVAVLDSRPMKRGRRPRLREAEVEEVEELSARGYPSPFKEHREEIEDVTRSLAVTEAESKPDVGFMSLLMPSSLPSTPTQKHVGHQDKPRVVIPPSPTHMERPSILSISPQPLRVSDKGERPKLREITDVVNSFTFSPPPAKRQKTQHYEREAEQHALATGKAGFGLEQPLSPASGYPDSKLLSRPAVPYDYPHPLPTSPTPVSVSPTPIIATSSSPQHNYRSLSYSSPQPEARHVVAELTPAASAMTPPTTTGTTTAKTQKHMKLIPYRSPDTGATAWTNSLLMIASIRGSARQTARHVMAFGVKVPEEVSEVREFAVPDGMVDDVHGRRSSENGDIEVVS